MSIYLDRCEQVPYCLCMTNRNPHVAAASAYLALLTEGTARAYAYKIITASFDANNLAITSKVGRALRKVEIFNKRNTGSPSDAPGTEARDQWEVGQIALVHWNGLLAGSVSYPGCEANSTR